MYLDLKSGTRELTVVTDCLTKLQKTSWSVRTRLSGDGTAVLLNTRTTYGRRWFLQVQFDGVSFPNSADELEG